MGQVKSLLTGGAGNPDLNRSVELHMQRGRDVAEDESAIAAEYHHSSGGRFLDEASVLLDHLRVLRLGQRDTSVVQNCCARGETAQEPRQGAPLITSLAAARILGALDVGGGECLIHPLDAKCLGNSRTDVAGASTILLEQCDDRWSHVALFLDRGGDEVILTVKQPVSSPATA